MVERLPATRRLVLPPAVESPSVARQACLRAAEDWGCPALAGSLELIASELVTNAVLHAQTDMELVLIRLTDGVRLEVHDKSAHGVIAPVVVPAQRAVSVLDDAHDLAAIEDLLTAGATTGRGLQLVDAVAHEWGYAEIPNGKCVWAVLRQEPLHRSPASDSPDRGADGLDDDGYAEGANRGENAVAGTRAVRLAAVPVRLALENDLQLDTLLRELQMAALSAAARAQAHDLVQEAERLLRALARPRRAAAVAVREAVARGDRLLDVDLLVGADTIAQLLRLAELVEVAGAFDDLALLAPEPPPELVAFRRWYVEEITRQQAGQPPQPCPFPVVAVPSGAAPVAASSLSPPARATVERVRQALQDVHDTVAIARVLLAEAVEALGAAHASFCVLARPHDEDVEIVDSLGYPEPVSAEWGRFPLGGDLPASEALRTGTPVVLRTLAELDLRYPAFQGRPIIGDAATVCVPLLTGTLPSPACLVLGFTQSRDFSPWDHRLLSELAAAAADSLARVDATAEHAQRQRLARLADDIVREATAQTSPEAVLTTVTRRLAGSVFEWCSVHDADAAGRPRLVAAAHPDPQLAALAERVHRQWPPTSSATALGRCLHAGERSVLQVVSHELLRELAQDEDHLEALNQLGMGSVAVLPIPVAGRVAAALAVANAAGRYITDADLRFLEDVTTRVGSAAALADRAGRGESAPA